MFGIRNGQSGIDFDSVPFLSESNMSDSNFFPVTVQKPSIQRRPDIVPKLDLISMPQNKDNEESSSEDSSQDT